MCVMLVGRSAGCCMYVHRAACGLTGTHLGGLYALAPGHSMFWLLRAVAAPVLLHLFEPLCTPGQSGPALTNVNADVLHLLLLLMFLPHSFFASA